MAIILGIESTCDETAASIVVDGYDVKSNIIATQFDLHAKYRGVVPEIASRAHIENILPVIREAIVSSQLEGEAPSKPHSTASPTPSTEKVARQEPRPPIPALDNIDAIAVAHRPGLIGSLLIGVTAAKTLAWSLGKPLIGVDHVHAHLYSVVLETNVIPPMPAVALVVSGGHTALYHIRTFDDIELIGSTIDDAVGEAYDKVAAILDLPFPGGPVIDRLAQQGNPNAIHFPRSLLNRDSLDFSFSGLKTAVLYHVRGHKGRERQASSLSQQEINDVAASFQSACVDVISTKLRRALSQTNAQSVIIGGGVSANSGLRTALKNFDVPVFFPPLKYCTDNAAMTAGLAHRYFATDRFSSLSLDAITYSQFR